MKYAILNDQTTETYMGGAALVNQKIQDELIKSEHECDILIMNGENKTIPKNILEYDFYILANIAYFPEEVLYKIFEKPFVSFRHDIPVVLYTRPPSIQYEKFYKLWQTMFDKAKVNFFISSMQEKVFKYTFNIKNCEIIPPPLDLSGFINKNEEDRNGCLYLGDISGSRGCLETLHLMKHHYPDERYTFIGHILEPELVKELQKQGATVMDSIEHELVNDVMNSHKYFFYFPNIYDSFCLKILEAELCGMQVFSDVFRIGRYSYSLKTTEMYDLLQNSAIKLIINKLIE